MNSYQRENKNQNHELDNLLRIQGGPEKNTFQTIDSFVLTVFSVNTL